MHSLIYHVSKFIFQDLKNLFHKILQAKMISAALLSADFAAAARDF